MIQESIGIDSLASWDNALKTLGGLLLLYMGRGQVKLRDEMEASRTEMARWRVYLFGINNDNGLNGNVKLLMAEREERLKAGNHVHRRGNDD